MTGAYIGPDGVPRCGWCGAAPAFLDYHDSEWGLPVADDIALFEKLSLELFQSGLSWRTILAKRDRFRVAFSGFDFDRVAGFGSQDVERLLQDEAIVRHRGKIEAVITNARCAQVLAAEHGSLGAYLWSFEPKEDAPAVAPRSRSPESTLLAAELKRRGWRFVGPTTAYAFMQAAGLVNDHSPVCAAWERIEAARGAFQRPRMVR